MTRSALKQPHFQEKNDTALTKIISSKPKPSKYVGKQHPSINKQGLLWQSSSQDSVLPPQGAWIQSLVGELKSRVLPPKQTENHSGVDNTKHGGIHAVEQYSGINRSEALIHPAMWTNLENVTLWERRQTLGATRRRSPSLRSVHDRQSHRDRKQMSGCGGWRSGNGDC